MYEKGNKVELWVNKVGPFANPQEAYDYYTLPYCAPETVNHPDKNEFSLFNKLKTSHHLGEIIGGHTLRHSGHNLQFAEADESNILVEECSTQSLTEEQAQQFSVAAMQSWFYQMYVDDLPIWGMVGEMLPADVDLSKLSEASENFKEGDPLVPFVYTERDLVVSYNGNRIVKVDLVSIPMSLQQVEAGKSYKFKTFIQWLPTKEEFHSRFERYLDDSFFKHQIHWFSIFNSFMMILFLLGLVTLILLRTLRKDFARYAIMDDDEDIDEETSLKDKPSKESGWKQVHGDVFRAPPYLTLFSAVLGIGWQLLSLTLGVILFALAGPLHGEVHEERGEVLYAVLICYSLSSVIAGYASGSYFKTYFTTISRKQAPSDSQWQLTMLLTVVLLPLTVGSILTFLNTIAWFKGTVNYIPFFAMLKLFSLWIFVSVPLCIVGTLMGRHTKTSTDEVFPCRVNAIPRPIPEHVPWYGMPQKIIPFAGLLTFGSIFIELYYVLTSFWNYKVYHVYGFLFGVYFILVLVVSLSTIIVVYFTLSAENYLWQWTAFLSGASTSLYVFIYGVYFFLFRTNMFGLTQTCFYFGYTILLSFFLGAICGTIGYIAGSYFVRSIFGNIKLD